MDFKTAKALTSFSAIISFYYYDAAAFRVALVR